MLTGKQEGQQCAQLSSTDPGNQSSSVIEEADGRLAGLMLEPENEYFGDRFS